MKSLAALSVLASALFTLGWIDAFHLLMTLLSLLLGGAAWAWWNHRNQPVDPEMESSETLEDEGPTTGDRLRAAFFGILVGGGILAMAAALSAALSATPVYGLFYDRSCEDVLSQVQTLDNGKAYAYALTITEQRLKQRASPACRARLSEQRARLLLALADSSSEHRQEDLLRQALQQADLLQNNDLVSLIRSRQQLAEQQSMIAQLQKSQVSVHNVENGLAFDLPDVLFEPGNARLASSATQAVGQIANVIRKNPDKSVRVNGYTDNIGTQEFNQQLSHARAGSVARMLVSQGIPEGRIAVQGFGASRPVAPNDTPAGRSQNRRVEVVILN